MRIGLDVDSQTNIKEGYLIMEFKKRELMPKGILNPETSCRFLQHVPDYVLEEMYGSVRPVGQSTLITDQYLNANDLWKMYKNDKESIDSLIGEQLEFPTDEYYLLRLADAINSYCGLE